jgi:hypothetical protein
MRSRISLNNFLSMHSNVAGRVDANTNLIPLNR